MAKPEPDPTQSSPVSASTTHRLTSASSLTPHLPSLTTLLTSVVNDHPATSSIGFLAPLSPEQARAYWQETVGRGLDDGLVKMWVVAVEPEGEMEVVATVQLLEIPKATHSHRAEVVKLMVSPMHQRHGYGARLMSVVEAHTRASGKELLTLDTATLTPAKAFYQKLGWEEWGECKGYASWADGGRCDATFFRKTF